MAALQKCGNVTIWIGCDLHINVENRYYDELDDVLWTQLGRFIHILRSGTGTLQETLCIEVLTFFCICPKAGCLLWLCCMTFPSLATWTEGRNDPSNICLIYLWVVCWPPPIISHKKWKDVLQVKVHILSEYVLSNFAYLIDFSVYCRYRRIFCNSCLAFV